MSIASEITRISGNIADAYTALDAKGATLPAAGSQNSANLADTIDTITTGGGGSGDIFDTIKGYVDDYDLTTTFQDLIDDGFVAISTDAISEMTDYPSRTICEEHSSNRANTTISGFVFTDDCPDIYIRKANSIAVKIPSDATLTSIDSTYSKVEFAEGSEKWIIKLNYIYTYDGNFRVEITENSADTAWKTAQYYVKKVAHKFLDTTTYTPSSPQNWSSLWITSCAVNIEDIYAPNTILLKHTISNGNITAQAYISWGQDWFYSHGKIDAKKFISYYPELTYKVSKVTNGAIFFTGALTSYIKSNGLPFVLDCSADTTETTIYVGSPKPQDNTVMYNETPKELFIIPSDKWNLSFLPYGASTWFRDKLSTESYRFLADNAPNVTGKKIQITSYTQSRLNAVDATILTDLTSKGYTIEVP